jgi:hypothetical protein
MLRLIVRSFIRRISGAGSGDKVYRYDTETALDLGSSLEVAPESRSPQRLFTHSLLASQCFVAGASPQLLPLAPDRITRLTSEVFHLEEADTLEAFAWCIEQIVAETAARVRRDDEAA